VSVVRELDVDARNDVSLTSRRRKAVVVTNSIPGHDAGFAKSGHAHYLGSFVDHLVDCGLDLVLVVLAPRLDALVLPADALGYRIVSPDLRLVGNFLVTASPRALAAAAGWVFFAGLPPALQRAGSALRSLVRRTRGYAHVLGSFLSADQRAFVAACVARECPDFIVYDGIFNACGELGETAHWVLTHEVKSERARSFAERGVAVVPRTFSAETERAILAQAANVIAIQWDDATTFRQLVPAARVVVVPVTMSPASKPARLAAGPRCIFVGSGSFHNVDGLRWFVDACWPLVRRAVPDAVLDVYGSVCYRLGDVPLGVTAHGVADDLTAAYSTARLAVVPLRIGSGLKVKLVEALAYGLPTITTSVGAQGLTNFAPLPFLQADDAAAFAEHCVRVMLSPDLADQLSTAALGCAQRFSPAAAFAEFDAALGLPVCARSMEPASICVAVPTFRRAQQLRELLDGLALQLVRPVEAVVEVVVLDNDPSGSAQPVVEEARATFPFSLYYEHVEQAGLAMVRNRALAFAVGRFDYLAMIDDDEVPERQWIDALLRVARRTGCEAVVGPVFPIVPSDAPQWITELRAQETPLHRDGAVIREGWSCNALVSMRAVAELGLTFEPALNFAGGEDQLFFRQLRAAGAAIAFAADARVHESLSADRLTLRFNIGRAFRRGNSLSFCERRLDHTARTPVIRAAKAIAVVGLGLLRMPRTLGRDETAMVRNACEVARGFGMLAGLVGRMYQAYGRPA